MKENMLINTVLVTEIKQLIEQSRQKVAVVVNSEISMLYWNIGKKIKLDILNNKKRAEYGKQIIAILSQYLTLEYGRGWSEKQLHHCLYTVETFPDKNIFSTLCRELSWSHIRVHNPKPCSKTFPRRVGLQISWQDERT